MPEIRVPVMSAEDMREMVASIDGIAAKFKDDLMAKQRRRYRLIVACIAFGMYALGVLVGWWLHS